MNAPDGTRFLVWCVMRGREKRAWELIQTMPLKELDALEEALEELHSLLDARYANESLRKAGGLLKTPLNKLDKVE